MSHAGGRDPGRSRGLALGRVESLGRLYRLEPEATSKLCLLMDLLVGDARAPTAIRDPIDVAERHLADSLVALELEVAREARSVLDIGAGAGLPGLALAAALPSTQFVLLDSVARKTAFIARAAAVCGLRNIEVVTARAEGFAGERHEFDVVTARAVARPDVVAEYAAPLLRIGGTLVAWVGRRSRELDAAAARAAGELGLEGPEVRRVEPFPHAEHHHLYLMSKVRPTPERFPRRTGVALKRPLGGDTGAPASSDRSQR